MPTSFISLKTNLFDALKECQNSAKIDEDKQANAIVEHLTKLITQIPSSYDAITPHRESMFSAIEKIRIYADSIDTGFFSSPSKTLIEGIKKILDKPEYSREKLFKEFITHMEEMETYFKAINTALNTELTNVLAELNNKHTKLLETESRTLEIEKNYVLKLKELETNKRELDHLQEQLDKKNSDIVQSCQEITKKEQRIQELEADKEKELLKQEELVKKIKAINHEVDNKSHHVITFKGDIGVPVHDKQDPLNELKVGLDKLKVKLEKLQRERLDSSQKIQSLTHDIEKEISDKKLLKDNLLELEKTKTDLEHAKNELEDILDDIQMKLQEEEKNRSSLELAYTILVDENVEQEKALALTKASIKKLKSEQEDQERKYQEQRKNQTKNHEKEIQQAKKSHHDNEQSRKKQLQISEELNKTLESQVSLLKEQIMKEGNEKKLLKEDMQAKFADLEPLREKNELLRKELEAIKPQLQILTQQNEDLYQKICRLESQVTEIEKEKVKLEAQNKRLTECLNLKNVSPPQSPKKWEKYPHFHKQTDPIAGGSLESNPPRLDK